jgi:hypothetical protein
MHRLIASTPLSSLTNADAHAHAHTNTKTVSAGGYEKQPHIEDDSLKAGTLAIVDEENAANRASTQPHTPN